MIYRLALLPFLLSAGALAQPAFEVASVRQGGPVRADGLLDINLGTASHGTLTLSNTTLSECIQYAYSLSNGEQISGPDWIRDRTIRFEIVAKAPPDTPVEKLRLMLQTLLKERFGLELHSEPRKLAHLELLAAPSGPRLKQAESDEPAVRRYYGPGRLSYTRLTTERLAVLLSRLMKQPVFDRTGLTAEYDIELNWQPEDTPADADAAPKPDIFAAVQEQLGLKLAVAKTPLDVLVVDRADKVPTAN